MPIYRNSTKIGKITYGGNTIGKVFYGNNLVYSSYREVDLGLITINATGDYKNNYYCNAHAILIYDRGVQKLKITGYWHSKGDNVSGNVQFFPTNINVGAQSSQKNFNCYEWYNRETPGNPGSQYYGTRSAYVTTGGVIYLPLGHENVYRAYNQYDYASEIITLNPA